MCHFLAHPTVCCIHCAVRIFEMAGSHMPSFALERARDRARAFLHRRKLKTPRTEKPWAAPACFPPVEANPSKEFQILYKPKQTWHQVKTFMLKHGYKIYRMNEWPKSLHWVQCQDHRMLRGTNTLRHQPGHAEIAYDSAGPCEQ